MSSMPYHMGTLLMAAGLGSLGTNIFTDLQPASPADCITLYQYAGSPPELVPEIEHPGLQARIRNTSYNTGYSNANSVMTTLHKVHEQTIDGIHYLFVEANQSPECMGQDQNRRWEWIVNFIVTREY